MRIQKPDMDPLDRQDRDFETRLLQTTISDQIDSAESKSRELVAVALSGGLDSMVTALLLKDRGHPVLALHMILRQDQPPEPDKQVRQLASRLGVHLHTVDLRQPFHQEVIKPFLDTYRRGRTPNPCVTCNPRIKFDLLLKRAADLGAERLATGHYARLRRNDIDGHYRLFRARDRAKDQSYFLYRLGQAQLARALFPLGDFLKSEVKQFAAAVDIADCHRPESQEICFIPDNDYRYFLEQHLGPNLPGPGPVLDLKGQQLGEHRGIHRYTIGQRRGLGIASAAPYYVVGLEPETNTVRVGRASDLSNKQLLVTNVNWLSSLPPTTPMQALVQVRSRHREAPAVLEPTTQGVLIRFVKSQTAITPGQAAVFYQDDEVLGGGTIHQVIP